MRKLDSENQSMLSVQICFGGVNLHIHIFNRSGCDVLLTYKIFFLLAMPTMMFDLQNPGD